MAKLSDRVRRAIRRVRETSGGHTGLDVAEWGRKGAFYIGQPRYWVRRHVESLELHGDRFGRRQLTIDLTLPRSVEPIIAKSAGMGLYCIPAAVISKRTPRSRIDFRDESDRRLPLLTRAENNIISFFAIRESLRVELGREPPDGMIDALLEVLAQSDRGALFQLYLFEYVAKKEVPELASGDAWPYIRATVESLVNDTIVWVPFEGRSGDRRSIRLSYEISIGPPSAIAQRVEERDVEWPMGEETVTLPVPRPVGIDVAGTLGRFANRIGVALGLSAIDLEFRRPAFAHTASYHFQCRAPSGLEVRRLVHDAVLVDRDGGAAREECFVAPQSGHLYVRDFELVTSGRILLGLRPTRTGLVNQALVASAVIAALLWLFATHWDEVSGSANSQSAAAVLLVGPALLAAFVYRPEHGLAARLLTGVRGLVLLAGLASIATAGGLIGAVRFGMSPVVAARAYAGVATAALVWLSAIFIRSLPWHVVSKHRRRWWTQAVPGEEIWLAGVVAGAVIASLGELHAVVTAPAVTSAVVERTAGLAVASLALVYVSGWSMRSYRQAPMRCVALAAAVAAFGLGLAQLCGVSWEALRCSVVGLALGSGLLIGLATASCVRFRRAKREGPPSADSVGEPDNRPRKQVTAQGEPVAADRHNE